MRHAPPNAATAACRYLTLSILLGVAGAAGAADQRLTDGWTPSGRTAGERTRSVQDADQRAEVEGPRALLIRNADSDPGAPPYALADEFGRVRRYVEPTPGVDLERFVGTQVRVRHDTGKTLLATQLDLPDRLEPLASTTREERPARFTPARDAERLQPLRRDRVRRVQFAEETPTEADDPIVLEELIGDAAKPADDLPAPARAKSKRQLEPIPTDSYDGPFDHYEGEVIIDGEDYAHSDYQHGRGRYTAPIVDYDSPSCDCDKCRGSRQVLAPATCRTCGGGGWCGPSCNPASRRGLYGRAEYLLWWFDGMDTPPLVTRNTEPNRPDLASPGTQVLYGGELLDDARSGLRFTLGAWLDDQRDFGIEGDYLFMETESEFYSAGDPDGDGIVSIGRPFYDIAPIIGGIPSTPRQNVQLVTLPEVVGGTVGVAARSEFESVGIRLRTGICCREVGCGGCNSCSSCGPINSGGGRPTAISRIDFIGGYRYTSLDEFLSFSENATLLDSEQSLTLNESFAVDNDFHGVDLGFVYEWESRRWALELLSKIALGVTDQEVRINGTTTSNGVTSNGGLLAQSTNIGVYSRDQFSVLPELSARLAYRITPRLRASVAYSLLFWSNVVRPGDQIDFSVDSRVIEPAIGSPDTYRHPNFAFNDTSIWAHGFNFGLDYQY
ncbi:BBP7 family outer membrane beta-barrel protein [Botrimarina hoheduenensis]|uniref:Outer membrane protein beta-barrel domain-containing protein n=1 Tax=Botrimarina hoheduenensis TaxID=2528000 RepID=A0A5C5WB31_9BACT|nr:BBP7 family outer membrane beta-barrel protein [Botrimarina hoheduenensis]TWT47289.1 hypothetical protein Pla111_09020 [Botrimarina hoheduenensis]